MRITKSDRLNHLYVLAVAAVKSKGVQNSQAEIYRLIDGVVVKKTTIEPLHTSHDIQSQTYLKILDWLENGKRGQNLTIEQILHPSHIRKTASSFGFSGAKYPAPVCRLEDWSPVEHLFAEEDTDKKSRLLDTWLKYRSKLDSVAKLTIYGESGCEELR